MTPLHPLVVVSSTVPSPLPCQDASASLLCPVKRGWARCVVISIIVVPPSEFTLDGLGFLVGGQHCLLLLLVSTDPFPPMVPSPGDFPPGSQISRAPIFRVPLWRSSLLAVSQRLVPMPAFALIWGSLYGTSTPCSPFCGSTLSSPSPPHGGILFMHPALPFRSPRSSASSLCLPPYTGVSCPCPASPYAQGSNASCSAVMALSASPASSMLEALSARAGVASTPAAPPLVRAHQCPRV